MRFIDNNIKLIINNLPFKAYLEDSDVSYETRDVSLPFAPTSFVNDKMATRLMQKAKFTFNVFSETRLECISNYNNLLRLIYSIKPFFEYIDDQLAPLGSNITGLVSIRFAGMPMVGDSVNLHLNSFSYTINKEIGYIQVPNKEIRDPRANASFYDSSGMKLIPLAYKISLEGKILLPFDGTVRQIGGPAKNVQEDYDTIMKDIFGEKANDREYTGHVLNAFTALTGRLPSEFSREKRTKALKDIAALKNNGAIDANGNFTSGGFTADEAAVSSMPEADTANYSDYQTKTTEIRGLTPEGK